MLPSMTPCLPAARTGPLHPLQIRIHRLGADIIIIRTRREWLVLVLLGLRKSRCQLSRRSLNLLKQGSDAPALEPPAPACLTLACCRRSLMTAADFQVAAPVHINPANAYTATGAFLTAPADALLPAPAAANGQELQLVRVETQADRDQAGLVIMVLDSPAATPGPAGFKTPPTRCCCT